MSFEERPDQRGDLLRLADEVVVRPDGVDVEAEFAGVLDDRFPVHGVVALAVAYLYRTRDVVECGDRVEVGGDSVGRCEDAHGGERFVDGRGGDERERRTETEPEQCDPVVAVGGPADRVPDVLEFAVALVPLAVVDAEAVDAGVGHGLRDGDEAFVTAVAAVLWMGRARDDAGVGVGRGFVEAGADVPTTRDEDWFGRHVYTFAQ